MVFSYSVDENVFSVAVSLYSILCSLPSVSVLDWKLLFTCAVGRSEILG